MWLSFLFLAVFFTTYYGIEIYRRWSLKNSILDIPNERSSHQNPTPRGGGLVLVIICLAGFLVIQIFSPLVNGWNYLIGAILIAAVSWLDDLYRVNIIWRFAVHSLAAILLLFGDTNLWLPFWGSVEFGWLERIVWFLWIVWLVNAYNFMDGIDGIAGMQAITAGIGWAILAHLSGIEKIFIYDLIITVAAFAFLFHNWQPAKIFMGDVGSAFFGYTFAAIPLIIQRQGENNLPFEYSNWFVAGIIFVYFFVFDSVLTFLRRLSAGEKVWQAHRSHLYQRMVEKGWRHSAVTIIYGVFSFLIVITFLAHIFISRNFTAVLLIELTLFSAYIIYQGWIRKSRLMTEIN